MQRSNEHGIGRRPVLKGAGVTLGALGGLASPVSARKGKGRGVRRLSDRPADILVYWSLTNEERDDPNDPSDFGYPGSSDPSPPGGLTFAGHDPAGGGLFDFSRIKMLPNNNLQNKWVLMGGAVMATGSKAYLLHHLGGGFYQSDGQEMTFKARSEEEIEEILGMPRLPPALSVLAGRKWRAVGLEYAQLGTDDDEPDPTSPEWATTRIDFFDLKEAEYTLSLIYLIGADPHESPDPSDGIPEEAHGAAIDLMSHGRLQPSNL